MFDVVEPAACTGDTACWCFPCWDRREAETVAAVMAAEAGLPMPPPERAVVSDDDLVRDLRRQARMIAHHQARLCEAVVAIVRRYETLEDDIAWAMEGAVAEVRAALSLTRRAAESQVELAASLGDRLPLLLAALRDGDVDLPRVTEIVDGTIHLTDERAAEVCSTVLAGGAGKTTGQLRAWIRRLCIDADPHDAARRYALALEERAVVARPTEAGTATIVASDLPPERVAAIMDRLTYIARSLGTGDEARSIDQRRADVMLDLLEGTADLSRHRRGIVDIRVDLTTLVGLDERSGELAGFGPVVADICRSLAETYGAQWRITVTDGRGELLHSDVTRRRPTAAMRRRVEARDETCVFPGCRMPARSSDLDHRIPYAEGGRTEEDGLVASCRHDHVVRHRHNWTHLRNPDGSHTWISPLGNTYIRPPPD
jgi:hypothetical protein